MLRDTSIPNYFQDLDIPPTLNPRKIQLAHESMMKYFGPLGSPKDLQSKLRITRAYEYLSNPIQLFRHYKYIKKQLANKFTFHSVNYPHLTLFSNYPINEDFLEGAPYPKNTLAVNVDLDDFAFVNHQSKSVYLYKQELTREGMSTNQFALTKVIHETDLICSTFASACLIVYFDILIENKRAYSGISHISPLLDLQASLLSIYKIIKEFAKGEESQGYFYLFGGTKSSFEQFSTTFNPEEFEKETRYKIDTKSRLTNTSAEEILQNPEFTSLYVFHDCAYIEKTTSEDESEHYKQEFNFESKLTPIETFSDGYSSDSSRTSSNSERSPHITLAINAARSNSNSSLASSSSEESLRIPVGAPHSDGYNSDSMASVSSEETLRITDTATREDGNSSTSSMASSSSEEMLKIPATATQTDGYNSDCSMGSSEETLQITPPVTTPQYRQRR